MPIREQNILISVYNDKVLLTQRKGKFLHGLWGFDRIEVAPCASDFIGEVTHAYTHFKLTCKVFVSYETHQEHTNYFSIEKIQQLAISKVDEKIVKLFLDTM